MTCANHSEACGHCHQSPCCCAVTVCGSPEETMWSGSQVALTWSEAWAIDNPGLVKMQVEGTLSYEAQRERAGFRFGFEAAQARGASRAPVEAGVVTSLHRQAAWSALYKDQSTKEGSEWVSTDGDIPPNEALKRLAQAIADAEARGASRGASRAAVQPPPGDPSHWATFVKDTALTVNGLMAEVERLKAELNSLPDRFSMGAFADAGISLNESAIALVVARRILEESDCKPPPADEVAGLLADLDMVRGELRDYALEHPSCRALDRIENHLKGKR